MTFLYDRHSDLPHIALLSALGVASCAGNEDRPQQEVKKKGEEACWTCAYESSVPDPAVQFLATPEEAVESVLGSWEGEYWGEPFTAGLQLSIEVE